MQWNLSKIVIVLGSHLSKTASLSGPNSIKIYCNLPLYSSHLSIKVSFTVCNYIARKSLLPMVQATGSKKKKNNQRHFLNQVSLSLLSHTSPPAHLVSLHSVAKGHLILSSREKGSVLGIEQEA